MSDFKSLPDGDWLGDHDMAAWSDLQAKRGGCRCYISSPCFACTEPPTEQELNSVGFTYENTRQEGNAA